MHESERERDSVLQNAEYLNLSYCVGLCKRTARMNLFNFNFLYPTSVIDTDLEKRHKIADNCTELLFLYKMSTYIFYPCLGTHVRI
jgi:hypothetical protein